MRLLRFNKWFHSAALAGFLAGSAVAETIELENSAGPGKITIEYISPVEHFRNLLAMSAAELESALNAYPAQQRKVLSSKLQEYKILPPEVRELRLCYTDMRWHLAEIIKLAPADRQNRLTEIPPQVRPLVEQRLKIWDGWSPEIQNQFLENETAMELLLQHGGSQMVTNSINLPTSNEKELQRWRSLSDQQRQEICDRFNQFFNLDADEKQKALRTLSNAQRTEMERKLESMKGLSAEERKQRIEALKRFSAMSPQAQKRFLQNAARWKTLSAKDRETWRKAASQLPPMPPMPPGLEANLPPMPPGLPPLPPLPENPKAKKAQVPVVPGS